MTAAHWASAEAYYVRLEEIRSDGPSRSRFHPTVHTQGAWREEEQHMAPVSGLLTAEIMAHQRREDLRIARLNFEILGTLHGQEFDVVTTTIRPGRTIELVEAVMVSRGRPCLVGRAWRLATSDTSSVSTRHDPLMPGPDAAVPYPQMGRWPGGYIDSVEVSALEDHAPGHGRTWLTNPYPMVEGEQTDPLVKLVGMVDTANGVAPVLEAGPGGHSFANVDLQIHLHRLPAGEHLGLQTTSNVGPDGVGLTSAVLHDVHGPFGRSEQIQTIRRIPSTP
ncbi:thioesterase family protein [Micrococcus sp. IITD107]|uniref:thioesterase family protein n=1 Tax=Micrococcus sp. IITD107 TaxID=3342790 RepID=UPI0035B885D2